MEAAATAAAPVGHPQGNKFWQMANRSSYIAGWVTVGGAIVFFVTVLALHMLQPGYDPVHQLMSALALGPHGWLMRVAFSGLAVSILAAQYGLASFGAPLGLRTLLIVAALSLFGAGIFRLGDASQVHVALVDLAFVSLVLAMYLLARLRGTLVPRSVVMLCWGLIAGTIFNVALGCSVIPVGIGQRAATLCVLVWLGVMGWMIIRVELVNRRGANKA